MKKILITISIFCLITIPVRAEEKAKVISIYDGDTIRVEINGVRESVRFIGIDTCESILNSRAYKQAYTDQKTVEKIIHTGKEAKLFLKTLVKKGDIVTLEYDKNKRGKYKRLLAYVYLENGKMLNEEMLKQGYAQLLLDYSLGKHEDRLFKAYRYARQNKLGLFN